MNLDYTCRLWFHDRTTVQIFEPVSQAIPPAVGDLVVLHWVRDGGRRQVGTFRVVDRGWDYPQPGSTAWTRGDRGASVTLIVEEADGIFAYEEAADE